MKDGKMMFFGGPYPVLSVKRTQIPFYIVMLDYGDIYRLYNFGKDGLLCLLQINPIIMDIVDGLYYTDISCSYSQFNLYSAVND
ncbi:MAG: hypothetical protein ACFFG0_12460 [Candidatus Thorarchaeota archaeon]